MKNLSKSFLLFLILSFSSAGCYSEQNKNISQASVKTIKLSFVGDLMNHTNIFEFARISSDTFDFNPYFEFVKSEISSADFAIGNLETVVYGEGKKPNGYPMFNAPIEYLEALKSAGFDILATANNHIADFGNKGVLNTLLNISDKGLEYVGTNLTSEESKKIKIFKKNGISFALLNYTYNLNRKYSFSDEYSVNLIDTTKIKKDLEKAKNEKPDFIVIYYHFGDEYKNYPNSFQKKIVDFSIKNGADIIVGSHPHVLQPFEVRIDSFKQIQNIIAYSLGNFISNQRQKYTDGSGILNIFLSKSNETSKIDSVEFISTWVFRGKINEKNTYRILPADFENYAANNFLTYVDKEAMQKSIENNKKILNKSIGIKKDYLKIK